MSLEMKFDLVDEAWIPCIDLSGKACELGLRDVLLRAHELREIYDDSPLTTIALHRVPLAILQRCRAGKTRGERLRSWKAMWSEKQFSAQAIEDYLEKWRNRFNLFSESHPFFQTAHLEMKESSALARLAMEEQLTSAIFMHDESPQWHAPTPALAARLLVTTQSFALGFGRSRRATINGEEIEPPYSADAILLRGVTVWLSGANLFETLMLNLSGEAANEEDAPCWELEEPHILRDTLVKGKRQTELPRGPMDRLTWQSRLMRLLPEKQEGRIAVKRLYFTQGRSLEKTPDASEFEPMKAYRKSKAEGFMPVALSEQKAAWRDAHVLLERGAGFKAPACIEQTSILVGEHFLPHSSLYSLHVVGMAAEPGKAGKFLLWRHERMPAPAAILEDANLVAVMRAASEEAEFVANDKKSGMGERMRRVCRLFLAPECEDGGRKPHPDDVSRLADEFDPRRAYWPRLEAHFHRLLFQLGENPDDREVALETWREAVEKESTKSFREALHSFSTSRQRGIPAVAHVSDRFFTKRVGNRNNRKKEVKV